jgi:uncharacterized protein (TIGR03083 family)
MPDVELTRTSALDAHARATNAFAGLVRTMPIDPLPVRHLRWDTVDVAAHVLSVMRAYADMARGGAGWRYIDDGVAENERLLAETPERRPGEIADAITRTGAEVRELYGAHPGDLVGWHAGTKAPVDAVLGVALAELLVHGWDIARALRRPWTITPGDATLAVVGALTVAPFFVSPRADHVRVTYVVRLRTGPVLTAAFTHGTLTVTTGEERADCRITADPVTFLLVGTGRLGLWRAVLRRGVRVGGRRPWLGPQLLSLLDFP